MTTHPSMIPALFPDEPPPLHGFTQKFADGIWMARIMDGWHVAFAKTQQAAMDKVTKQYYEEMRR